MSTFTCRAGIRKGLQFTNSLARICAMWWNEGICYWESAFPGMGAPREINAIWSFWLIPSEDAFSVAFAGHSSILLSSSCNYWSTFPENTGVLMLFLHQRISTSALYPVALYPWFPNHFHEGVLSHRYSCLLWLVRLPLNLFAADQIYLLDRLYIPIFQS